MDEASASSRLDRAITAGTTELHTRLGRLRFERGYPTAETAAKLYDAMDFQRATEAYLWALPLVSYANWRKQLEVELGVRDMDFVVIASFTAHVIVLTASATIPYVESFIDVGSAGPTVLHLPPDTPMSFMDLWQRPIYPTDGAPRDLGAGASYLILGPGQDVEDAGGFTVLRSRTSVMHCKLHAAPRDAADATRMMQGAGLQSYGEARAGRAPRPPRIIEIDRNWPAYPPRGLEYWRVLNEALNAEHREARDAFAASLLASLGLGVGKPFSPDARLAAILSEGALVGEAMARALTYSPRHDRGVVANGWRQIFDFEADEQMDGARIQSDERAAWFYEAVNASPILASKAEGDGALYLAARTDADGDWLDGSRRYRLHIPPNIPAKRFWSVTAYSTDTRCLVDTPHQRADCTSRSQDTVYNDDGSVDVWFGPEQPAGAPHANWVATRPGEGFFLYFRLNQPRAAFFDRTWVLPGLEKAEPAG